jgi:hypothetical protein
MLLMARSCRFRISALRSLLGLKRTRYAQCEFFAFRPTAVISGLEIRSATATERLLNVGFCCEAYSNRHVHRAWKNLSEVRENPSRW